VVSVPGCVLAPARCVPARYLAACTRAQSRSALLATAEGGSDVPRSRALSQNQDLRIEGGQAPLWQIHSSWQRRPVHIRSSLANYACMLGARPWVPDHMCLPCRLVFCASAKMVGNFGLAQVCLAALAALHRTQPPRTCHWHPARATGTRPQPDSWKSLGQWQPHRIRASKSRPVSQAGHITSPPVNSILPGPRAHGDLNRDEY
jgi:hypothetical protein